MAPLPLPALGLERVPRLPPGLGNLKHHDSPCDLQLEHYNTEL